MGLEGNSPHDALRLRYLSVLVAQLSTHIASPLREVRYDQEKCTMGARVPHWL